MKKFLIFLIILLAIGSGIYVLSPSLESIIQNIVHKYGSQVTGTDVNLGGFKLSLLKGNVEINNLTVANPKNYTQPYIMSVGKVAVKVNLKSIFSDTIVIENVQIENPKITYELLSLTQNNLSQLLDNINKNTTAPDKNKSTSSSSNNEEKNDIKQNSKKVIVQHRLVSGGEINLAASIAGQSASARVPLPTIEMNDIGKQKNQNGTNIADTLSAILQKIFSTAYNTVVNSKLADMKTTAEESLNSVVEGIKNKSGLKKLLNFAK